MDEVGAEAAAEADGPATSASASAIASAIAEGAADLSAEWITSVLQAAGHDLVVSAAEAQRVGTGQMGMTFRLTLRYEGTAGPATLIVKVAGEDEVMRSLVAPGYAAEVGFYQALAHVLGVRTPRCWYAAISDDNQTFTLVLDDASPAQPGVQAHGCTPEQARAALRNLVGLHAPRWNDAALYELRFLQRRDEASATMMQQVLVSATEGFVERYRDVLGDDDVDTLRAAAEVIGRWQLARPEPFSVLHGDYRLDNLLFPPAGDEVVAVDWQTAAIGPPLRDVAYFLGTSLDTELRREHERRLVSEYHDALVASGVTGYSFDSCWDDYRLGQLQGPLITVLGCMYSASRTEQSDAMFLAMIRRSCAAIRDVASLELV